MLSSECPEPPVCRANRCTNICVEARDCPPDSQCSSDGMVVGCMATSTTECTYDSECLAPLVCGLDRRCRAECILDRDCRYGEICDRSAGSSACVVPPAAPAPAVRAAALGRDHSCALTGAHEVYCWGRNQLGQLGDGSSLPNTAVVTTPVTNAVALALGTAHSCALLADGTMSCWGDDSSVQIRGRLPKPPMASSLVVPPQVVDPLGQPLSGLIGIAAGDLHTCAWTASTLYCWSDNTYGQLGPTCPAGAETPCAIALP